MTDNPRIERTRLETRRRVLTIRAVDRLSPAMLRLTLAGPDLEGFASPGASDHIKLFVPDGAGGTTMRDYTPRRHDPVAGTLDIDFAVHDAGPATLWALGAKVGDRAEIGGPRGSQAIVGPIRGWVLVGDETALPSIARRIEEMDPDLPVTALVAVPAPEDAQTLSTVAALDMRWILRDDPRDGAALRAALAAVDLPEGTFVWIAAEAGVARALRDDLLARGYPAPWIKAAGYWIAGQADAAEKDL